MEGQVNQKRTTFQGPCYLKMLVNNLVAGAIIGKSGSVIASIEQSTGCSLKLSPSNAFYPGTNDRVLILGGQQDQLNSALVLILEKIRDTMQQFGDQVDGGRVKGATDEAGVVKIVCKLAVPKSAVSAIIGKGGQQIRELQDQTQARVQVSSREEGLVERMITISGNIDQVRTAVLAVASCIQTDPNLKDHMYVLYRSTGGFMGVGISGSAVGNGYMNSVGGINGVNNMSGINGQYGQMGVGFNGSNGSQQGGGSYGGGQYGGQYGVSTSGFPALGSSATAGAVGSSANYDLLNSHCDIIIQVPDTSIGFVIGKNGSCVSEIIQSTGARIQISQKGDLVPGTNERRIVISGTVCAVHSAHMLLLQRIHSVNEFNKKNQANGSNGSGSDRNNTANSASNAVSHSIDQQGVYVM